MFSMMELGTVSGLNRRIERRVRKKLCRSIVGVKVSRFDLENDSLLSLSVLPGFVIVFECEPIDMLICTFSCITYNLTTHAKITIKIIRVLQGHRHLWANLHVAVFDTTFISIYEDVFAIGIKPDRCDLWRTIRHKSC